MQSAVVGQTAICSSIHFAEAFSQAGGPVNTVRIEGLCRAPQDTLIFTSFF